MLDYAGQDVALYDHEEAVTDLPTNPEILKLDALDHETVLPGAKFRVWNDEGTFDEELVTDDEGQDIARLRQARKLPHPGARGA